MIVPQIVFVSHSCEAWEARFVSCTSTDTRWKTRPWEHLVRGAGSLYVLYSAVEQCVVRTPVCIQGVTINGTTSNALHGQHSDPALSTCVFPTLDASVVPLASFCSVGFRVKCGWSSSSARCARSSRCRSYHGAGADGNMLPRDSTRRRGW